MTQPAAEAAVVPYLEFGPKSCTEGKKRYDKTFLLSLQFVPASLKRPDGLPPIRDVVFDKPVMSAPHHPHSESMLTCGNQLRPGAAEGIQRAAEKSFVMSAEVQLNQAENAWKPSVRKPTWTHVTKDVEESDADAKILLKQFRGILNKMMPEKLDRLMRQVAALKINTEEKLKGVVDLIFEKAIAEPTYSEQYAKMSRMLSGLKVPCHNKPAETVNFRKMLLKESLKEFQSDKMNKWVFEKKMEELKDSQEEEKQRLAEELQEAKDRARRRSLGHTVFMGELFKLKMITGHIMHDYITKLLKNHDEESLECLCKVFLTIGKNLDVNKSKTRIDQYCNQMKKIIRNRKTSFRICFKLQDVLDLRQNNWVPRKIDQRHKSLEQNHTGPELEVPQALKKNEPNDSGLKMIKDGAGDFTVAGSLTPTDDMVHQNHLDPPCLQTGDFHDQLLGPAADEDTKQSCSKTTSTVTLESGKFPIQVKLTHTSAAVPGPEPSDCSTIQQEPQSSLESILDPERLADEHQVTKNEEDVQGAGSAEPVCRGDDGSGETFEKLKTAPPTSDIAPELHTTEVSRTTLVNPSHRRVQNAESTLEPTQKNFLSAAELTALLDTLIRDNTDNQSISDWSEELRTSNMFLRVLTTCICKSAIICDKVFTVNVLQIYQRAELLQNYLRDEQKQLQALHALQALMVQMDHPPYLLRMFFVALHDQDVISDEAFFRWESSTDPEEQQGRSEALKSVAGFLAGLREAKAETEYSELEPLDLSAYESWTCGDSEGQKK